MTADEAKPAPKFYFRNPSEFDDGYGVEIEPGGGMWVFDDSWAVMILPEDRHKLAAFALRAQSFGFTREDVEELETAISGVSGDGMDADPLRSIRDRIAALLPPDETA